MPSTYSNLKIQLMATGENATTWGTVTNLNLGTAIEEAIANSTDVTFASANITLTLTDTNASQPARNMRLRCTGTTGGSTRNLVVPSIEKPYIMRNDCADSVVVKTSAGTGITVPAGRTMWVYSDGTNVVDVVTHLSSLTLGAPLPIAQGGTGANTATDARTALGLGSMATQNSTGVSITGGSISGITPLAIASGGTGSNTAPGARTNLGLGTLATLNTINNSNWSGTALAIANGGTGSTSAPAALSALGAYPASNPNGYTSNAGTVTSVSGTGTVNGITLSGTVTSSGNLTLGGTLSGVSLTTQVTGTLPVANGGTGSTNASGAQTNLDVPSRSGSGASGTWGINITGNAATATSATSATSATNATNAANLVATNFSILQSGTNLLFRYNGVTIAILDSAGNFTAKQDVTAFGSI
jgi:hypothetical protein